MNWKEKKIHLPDLQFCKLCEDIYGVNRGVYNTIEDWFSNKGINNILIRRTMILDFLAFTCGHSISQSCKGKFKFGHGGLTIKLEEFFYQVHPFDHSKKDMII